MAKYRSNEMTHKFHIDAVDISTSNETQTSHNHAGKPHMPLFTSWYNDNGMIMEQTERSVKARESMKKFCTVLSCFSLKTEMMTKAFPNSPHKVSKGKIASAIILSERNVKGSSESLVLVVAENTVTTLSPSIVKCRPKKYESTVLISHRSVKSIEVQILS